MTFSAGDTVHVTIEGTVISTTQGSFVAVSFRDAYANWSELCQKQSVQKIPHTGEAKAQKTDGKSDAGSRKALHDRYHPKVA